MSITGPTARNITAGTLSALVTLSYSVSYAALVFSGKELQGGLPAGIHAALISAAVIALIVALWSSFEFAIAGPDSNATAVLAVMSASIVASRPALSGNALQSTVLMMLIVSSLLTGILVYCLGAIRRGRLASFLPFPVIGGFLAGTGFLILSGGFKVLSGYPLTLEGLFLLGSVPPLGLAIALLIALVLLIGPRFSKHFLLMPAVIVAGTLIFYAGLLSTGMSIDMARDQGLLFRPLASGTQTAWMVPSFADVRWDVIAGQWENFIAMTIVVILTILLNATGIDLATRSDVDFDRELRVNGIANILSGLLGGMIGYLSISRSLLNYKAGAVSRFAGIWTAIVCLGATFAFAPAVMYLPKPVLSGLLLFLGLAMLRDWLWESFFKLPFGEYLLIAVILVLIVMQGLIAGVGFGLLVASVYFVYSYSQTTCIKHTFSSGTHSSNKERSFEETALLKANGTQARVLCLQGYIFFGSASQIVDTCRALIIKENVRYVLLDFRRVQGFDASAVSSFFKLEQIVSRGQASLLLCSLGQKLEEQLKLARFIPRDGIYIFEDIDRGLERVEETILADTVKEKSSIASSSTSLLGIEMRGERKLRAMLSAHFTPSNLDTLIGFCESIELSENTPLFRQGDPGDAMYFIERGELSASIRLEGGQTLRLRTFGVGAIVGEMGLYKDQPRSADVIANTPSRVRRLSAANLKQLEVKHPAAAVQLHTFVVKLLSSRLAAANEEIRTLL